MKNADGEMGGADAPELVKTRFFAGIWEGILSVAGGAGDAPAVQVRHLEKTVPHEISPLDGAPGKWALRIPVPPETLGDGVQTFVISLTETGLRLGSFTVVTGEPLEDDLRAEVDLLRAELDMLKRAFRRHCLESG